MTERAWLGAAALFAVVACGADHSAPSDGSAGAPAGASSGGSSTAGATAAGGVATGGAVASGGAATAGATTAGATTGGAATGGVSPGGGQGGGGSSAVAGTTSASGSGGVLSNSCEGKSAALGPWPGGTDATTLEPEALFEANVSGLTLDPSTGVLWVVENTPGNLYRMLPSGNGFAPDTASNWSQGKGLRYPSGQGAPDAEGVTFGATVAGGMYVCAEHDNSASSTSRQSVLRFDVSAAGATLTATHDWDLTALLPTSGANTGIEAVTWIPDTYLTQRGFYDEAKKRAYAPADYPDHAAGLFFVGVEDSGKLYAMALDHTSGKASLVATIATPNDEVMGLEFDRDTQQLWFHCDDGCDNESGILDIDVKEGSATRGRFVVVRRFERPSGLPDSNHEGIAIGPESACVAGKKPFYWADDADDDGFSLRRGSVNCGPCP